MDTAPYLSRIADRQPGANPLMDFLQIEPVKMGPQEVQFCLRSSGDLAQGAGLVGGGILATLADEAMAHLCLFHLGDGKATVTVELTMRYLKPAMPGDTLIGRAFPVKMGRTIMHVEAEVLRERDNECLARSQAVFMAVGK
ncbi:PaaI family thioesterase [Desulfurispirillum indicum]|uniref:Medium/long-chain acyl-CoA thioesterase YigI n=1 Tax=Desulfurispirillum indicum (strain ATCC BAA-1389 / DSM 22839 / S5) TaxID=653733 RepID=E6W3Z4_DESIS|nr:PaaI family thioesterase [Desulfurispirillum indicum]ADU65862.1 thioesterase superfamily protein [Desulfurispirillum indicum S5]UCZ57798.1 PaaI family thioesterase [Desulfurispirillum indicum]